jgi:hypothetical protein
MKAANDSGKTQDGNGVDLADILGKLAGIFIVSIISGVGLTIGHYLAKGWL